MKCNQCGCENKEDAKFCNQCGVKLITLKYKWMQLSRVKKISVVIVPIILLICIITGRQYYKNYQYETGYKLSYDQKENNIQLQLVGKNYGKAKQLAEAYGIYKDKIDEIDKIIRVYKNNDKIFFISDAKDIVAKEDYKNKCMVENIDFTNTHNGYCTAVLTIKNGAEKTMKHVKILVYFTGDNDNDVVDKEYLDTYKDGDKYKIEPNTEKKLTVVSTRDGSKKARAEVIEWE